MEKNLDVVIGSVLGDAHLYKLTKKSKSGIFISQHDSKYPYLEWLHSKIGKDFDLHPIRPKTGYKQHYFWSKFNLRFGELRNTFYHGRTKIIPSGIFDLLTSPRSIAVWYMDDGNLDKRDKYHFNSTFATYCFSFEECRVLCEVLNKNFGIKASVNQTKMRGKIYPRLYIWSESMNKFINTIKPFINPVFSYKIGDLESSAYKIGI